MTYRIKNINSWNSWDPLKQVMLGNCFSPDFFDSIADTKLRDLLSQILEETQEDLDNIQATLEQLGVDVVRIPENTVGLNNLGQTIENITEINSEGFPSPMIAPRDEFIAMGNRLLCTTHNEQMQSQNLIDPSLLDYVCDGDPDQLGPFELSPRFRKQNNFSEQEILMHSKQFWGPSVTRVGDTLVCDQSEIANLSNFLLAKYPHYKSSIVAIGGHNDASYCLPKPGLIICSPWVEDAMYKTTFPNWDILKIKNPGSWDSEFEDWEKAKSITRGRWWHPDAQHNPELVNFIDTWLNRWVGFSEETVFEINMLSIDENTILSLNYQQEVHDKLREHDINPIYCRFRHRNFWDSGLHCMTVDTVRQGTMKNYFGVKYAG